MYQNSSVKIPLKNKNKEKKSLVVVKKSARAPKRVKIVFDSGSDDNEDTTIDIPGTKTLSKSGISNQESRSSISQNKAPVIRKKITVNFGEEEQNSPIVQKYDDYDNEVNESGAWTIKK